MTIINTIKNFLSHFLEWFFIFTLWIAFSLGGWLVYFDIFSVNVMLSVSFFIGFILAFYFAYYITCYGE